MQVLGGVCDSNARGRSSLRTRPLRSPSPLFLCCGLRCWACVWDTFFLCFTTSVCRAGLAANNLPDLPVSLLPGRPFPSLRSLPSLPPVRESLAALLSLVLDVCLCASLVLLSDGDDDRGFRIAFSFISLSSGELLFPGEIGTEQNYLWHHPPPSFFSQHLHPSRYRIRLRSFAAIVDRFYRRLPVCLSARLPFSFFPCAVRPFQAPPPS